MRRSSCTLMMLLLVCSSFLPAPARAENDTRSISQRITELRNRLDSFCGNPVKSDAQSSKNSSNSATGKASQKLNEAQTDSALQGSSSGRDTEKSIDGEKFVLLPPESSEHSSSNVSPEGESAAIEHNRNVTMTVLFHDADAPFQAGKSNPPESSAKKAVSPTPAAKKP